MHPALTHASEPRLPHILSEAPSLQYPATAEAPSPLSALLIQPFYRRDPNGSFAKHSLTPSLALPRLAAATPAHWSVRMWDENFLQGPPPIDPPPTIAGITVHLTFAKRAYELASWLRAHGSLVVFGGPHMQACADEAMPHADAIVVGEGTRPWTRILRDVAQNRLRPRYEGDFRCEYAEEPIAKRSVLDKRNYLTIASLIAGRGCVNRCEFCHLSTDGMRMPYQTRPPEEVATEFRRTGEPYGVFIDNNLGADRRYLRDLCRALRPLNKIWSAAVTADVADDPELVREMAFAGCSGVFIGFESLGADTLQNAGKRMARTEQYSRQTEEFHRWGIAVNGSFVFGFDEDQPDVFSRTVNWIERHRLECATFHILTPYPGTPLFKRMNREGRLLHRNWDLYDTSHCVFRPKNMMPEELEEGYRWCYRRLFSPVSIWRRRPRGSATWPGYFAGAMIYKKINWAWPFLIQQLWTRALWRPLILTAWRARLRRIRDLENKVQSEDRSDTATTIQPQTNINLC